MESKGKTVSTDILLLKLNTFSKVKGQVMDQILSARHRLQNGLKWKKVLISQEGLGTRLV